MGAIGSELQVSRAKTSKLHCSECNRKIAVGQKVIFEISTDRGKPKMEMCYCMKCGDDLLNSYIEDMAESYAIGIGQD